MKLRCNTWGKLYAILHDASWIPNNGIGVEIFCRVKPEVELLLSISFILREHVCMDNIGISTQVSQELKINLVVVWSFWG